MTPWGFPHFLACTCQITFKNFPTAVKQFLTTHPWAARLQLCTLDSGLWMQDRRPRHVAEQPKEQQEGKGYPNAKAKKKEKMSRNKPWTKCCPGSGSACVAADVVAVHGQADGATAEWNGPKTQNEVEAGIRPRPRETVPKMFCNMRRVGKFIINSMRQHGSQTFHMLFKMPHCPMSQAGICPSVHPSLPSIHPFHPIPSNQSSQQLLAIFIYTYSVRTSTLGRLLLQHLDTPKCVKCIFAEFKFHNRMTTIGNSWASKFYI